MCENGKDASLIDWNSPILENHSRPLIPLPTSRSPIDIVEDNPFDAVERQINENEIFDVFNRNISFGNDSDSPKNSSDGNILIELYNNHNETIKVEAELLEINLKIDDNVPVDELLNYNLNFLPSENSNSNFEMSAVCNDKSLNASDLKELVTNRISNCINQALNRTKSDTMASQSMSVPSTKGNSLLNDVFLPNNSDSAYKFGKTRSVELIGNSVDMEEDWLGLEPKWDVMSSDEEGEKEILSRSLPLPPNNECFKKTPVSIRTRKSNNIREPLICQDANIKTKKKSQISSEGPLKAVIPFSGTMKTSQNSNKKTEVRKFIMPITKSQATTSIDRPNITKLHRPTATSTPQLRKYYVSTNNSRRSLSDKMRTSDMVPPRRAPSPDSTTGVKTPLRSSNNSRFRSKSCHQKSASNIITSSTPGTPKQVTTVNTTIKKSVHDKENLVPFLY